MLWTFTHWVFCALCSSWRSCSCRMCCVRFTLIELMVAERCCTRCFLGLRVTGWCGGEAPSLRPIWWPQLPRRPTSQLGLLGRAGWHSVGQQEWIVNTTRTEQRQATGFISLFPSPSLSPVFNGRRAEGQKLCRTVAGCLPHQHTAAATRGHQQRPVKEKH